MNIQKKKVDDNIKNIFHIFFKGTNRINDSEATKKKKKKKYYYGEVLVTNNNNNNSNNRYVLYIVKFSYYLYISFFSVTFIMNLAYVMRCIFIHIVL